MFSSPPTPFYPHHRPRFPQDAEIESLQAVAQVSAARSGLPDYTALEELEVLREARPLLEGEINQLRAALEQAADREREGAARSAEAAAAAAGAEADAAQARAAALELQVGAGLAACSCRKALIAAAGRCRLLLAPVDTSAAYMHAQPPEKSVAAAARKCSSTRTYCTRAAAAR